MADDKKTQVMSNDNRLTYVMPSNNPPSHQTEIMNESKGDRITSLMTSDSAIDFNRRSYIDGYRIVSVVAENTGEASLLLTEKDNTYQVIKLYHINIEPDKRLANILSTINSPYIMPYKKGGIFEQRTYDILPYFKNGDLTKYIPMSQNFLENIVIKSVNQGLKILHDNNIIHRDIKPNNLFLSDDKSIVILGDFGISSLLDKNISVRATSMSRTLGYSSPEASSGFVSKESDYYSFGITLLHLAIGQDPFEGMTDMQILYNTINKPLEIPATVPPRLQHLIRGLTVKDRNHRWGYDEVSRWLNNEEVEIQDRQTHEGLRPYNFMNNRYFGLNDISMAFANDWDNAIKHLCRGFVEKNVIQYGEEYANQIVDVKNIPNKDVAVFKMIYILNKNAPLCFKGEVYADLQSLGMSMAKDAPKINVDVLELINTGCLLEFIDNHNYDKSFRDQVEALTTDAQDQSIDYHLPYYGIMYLLYPELGFTLNYKRYVKLEDLIEDIEKNDNAQIAKICQNLISDKMFIMWIYSLGYSEQVKNWLNIYKKAVW